MDIIDFHDKKRQVFASIVGACIIHLCCKSSAGIYFHKTGIVIFTSPLQHFNLNLFLSQGLALLDPLLFLLQLSPSICNNTILLALIDYQMVFVPSLSISGPYDTYAEEMASLSSLLAGPSGITSIVYLRASSAIYF